MGAPPIVNLSRRRFLQAGALAGAGLTLGLYLPGAAARPFRLERLGSAEAGPETFAPNAFVRIDPDGTVRVVAKHLEMGQGTFTGLATLVAEELDADWAQVQVVPAPADAARYHNLFWNGIQGTGGSTAIANSYTQFRRAGAAAREMLVAAAAEQWGVPAGEITVRAGQIRHEASGRTSGFGPLVEAAARQPVPEEPLLKEPGEFRLIGTVLPRKDSRAKTSGRAVFTQDVQLDHMVVACVAHPPRFGARLATFDATEAREVPGVRAVSPLPTGVAVYADTTWAAMQGRDALEVKWDESGAEKRGTGELWQLYERLAGERGTLVHERGDAAGALERASKTVESTVRVPYVAHAAMEPLNCVVRLRDGGCEIWNGEQFQTPDQRAVGELLGIAPENVTIHMLYAGGSFGRRANPNSDYVLEAVHAAKALGAPTAVKLVWTREDDMRAGYYRPMFLHRMRAALDERGRPVAWHHRIVGQSIFSGTPMEGRVQDGVDPASVEGVADLPYAVENLYVDLHSPKVGVPVQWWRSVGHSHSAFAVETFVDELAAAAGRDPVEFRLGLLADEPRWRGVLQLAADKAGWGRALPAGRGRGVAVHKSFDSYVAQVAEVSVDGTAFTVDRVVIAVDCGIAVNPDVIRAQMEGGMGFGLGTALASAITLEDGVVEQRNFDGFEVLRLHQMPRRVEVHIVPSTEAPTGVGEPGVPPIAPAVANALAAATGKRLRELPLRLG